MTLKKILSKNPSGVSKSAKFYSYSKLDYMCSKNVAKIDKKLSKF
jgi:hypothetical protein